MVTTTDAGGSLGRAVTERLLVNYGMPCGDLRPAPTACVELAVSEPAAVPFLAAQSWDRQHRADRDPITDEANKARHPSGRFGRADEVANVVAFLASPMASWVSGQNLVVDGSFTLRIGY